MGSKISQYPERLNLTGEEEAIVAINGGNYKFKLKRVREIVTKNDVGLGNVDDTPDKDKPISTLQQAALDDKAGKDHSHIVGNVTGLQEALDDKATKVHEHQITDVADLQTALDAKSNSDHHHSLDSVDGLIDALGSKAALNHQHSKNAVNGLVDDLNALTVAINGKAASVHNHSPDQINGLEAYVTNIIANIPNIGDVTVDAVEW